MEVSYQLDQRGNLYSGKTLTCYELFPFATCEGCEECEECEEFHMRYLGGTF